MTRISEERLNYLEDRSKELTKANARIDVGLRRRMRYIAEDALSNT